jgi:threonine dehydrogenase-like Zn-dependent dehydrogenase
MPKAQFAVQLVGPSQLTLNRAKRVDPPGPHQVLAQIEAVGLCFSDLKLLKQFTEHPRKSEIISGLSREVLEQIPSYVPLDKPTVPGHETVCRIVAVGPGVKSHKVGERVLAQTDYRQLRTAGSNAAFGYNFEGALQEYVLMDERVIVEPTTAQRYLIPVNDDLGASAVCLVEPWACVEDSYVSSERQAPKAGGRMLVVADAGHAVQGLAAACREGKPAQITAVVSDDAQRRALHELGVSVEEVADVTALNEVVFDDIVYFGAGAATIEALNAFLANRGIINIVLGGRKIGQDVSVGVGRVHYGLTRWIGTVSADASEAYRIIPATGEIRAGDRIVVVGAGGPMGQMHVIRNICSGVAGISMTASDVDDGRLESLLHKAAPMASSRGVSLSSINSSRQSHAGQGCSYFALMAPVAALVADAIAKCADGAMINIFAGIPAPTRHALDMDTYIARRCYMFGTSGSSIRDMEIVLGKIEKGLLDTDCSVDAISGMAGAIEGLAAVENRTLAGKIIVYPCLHDLGLIPLGQLASQLPSVAAKLRDGFWCKAAEQELLAVAGRK